MQHLWMENNTLSLFESIPTQKNPVYILQGKYDKHTCTSVAKSYFDSLKAQVKKYFEFENSSHDPHIDEFERYKDIMVGEVLKR